jgi:cell division protein FtsL
MATQPAFLRRTEAPAFSAAKRTASVQTIGDRYQLRALPHEDLAFFCKKIDNSRLVREPDPKAPSACWSAIGTACIALALVTGVVAPRVAGTLAGYKLESLRAEERRLLNERQSLELQEAELTDVNRLEKLAKNQNLNTPAPGQLIHLNGKSNSAVAMVK